MSVFNCLKITIIKIAKGQTFFPGPFPQIKSFTGKFKMKITLYILMPIWQQILIYKNDIRLILMIQQSQKLLSRFLLKRVKSSLRELFHFWNVWSAEILIYQLPPTELAIVHEHLIICATIPYLECANTDISCYLNSVRSKLENVEREKDLKNIRKEMT